MIDLLVKILINAAALAAAVILVPNVDFPLTTQDDFLKLLLVALIFGVINSYLKPIVKLLSLPISLFTMGLVGIVINVAMLLLVAAVSGQIDLPFRLAGWPGVPFSIDVLVAALLASIVISIVSTVLSLVLGQKRILGVRV
jgi:putative membrane protein